MIIDVTNKYVKPIEELEAEFDEDEALTKEVSTNEDLDAFAASLLDSLDDEEDFDITDVFLADYKD